MSRGIILMDVDGCVNLPEPGHPIRPGLVLLCDTLTCLGFDIHLWSAGGAEHCRKEAERAGVHGSVTSYHAKPDYPMDMKAVAEVLGNTWIVMQIDDDPTERVGDWPFMVWGWDTTYQEGLGHRAGRDMTTERGTTDA